MAEKSKREIENRISLLAERWKRLYGYRRSFELKGFGDEKTTSATGIIGIRGSKEYIESFKEQNKKSPLPANINIKFETVDIRESNSEEITKAITAGAIELLIKELNWVLGKGEGVEPYLKGAEWENYRRVITRDIEEWPI
jgi:hypothetical protein